MPPLREKFTFLATNMFPPPPHLQHEQTPTRPLWHLFTPFLEELVGFLGASKGRLVPNINQPSRKSCFSNTPPGYCLVRLPGFQCSNPESDFKNKKTENGNLNKTNWFSLEFYGSESFGQFESCPTKRLAVMVAMQQNTILGVPSRNSMLNLRDCWPRRKAPKKSPIKLDSFILVVGKRIIYWLNVASGLLTWSPISMLK